MAIRVNLLPEARILKIKNQQTKRLTMLVCTVIAAGVGGTMVVLLLLLGARNIQSSLNDKSITDLKSQIASKQDIEQDAAQFNLGLSESARLSDNRILISQLFDRLTEALPKDVKLTDLSVDPSYKVKASVQALDFNTVDLFSNSLSSYNVTNRPIAGFARKAVFTDIRIDSVTSAKKGQVASTKTFDVTFQVDKALVQKFREDSKQTTGGSN